MTAQEAKEKTKESLNTLNEIKKACFATELERLKKEIDNSIIHAVKLGKYAISEPFIVQSPKLELNEEIDWTINEYKNFAAGIAKYLKENGYTFEVKPYLINSICVDISWSK